VPDKLQSVDLTVLENDQCQDWYKEAGRREKIYNVFTCAGFKKGEKDSCQVSHWVFSMGLFFSLSFLFLLLLLLDGWMDGWMDGELRHLIARWL